jgi:pectate lyase
MKTLFSILAASCFAMSVFAQDKAEGFGAAARGGAGGRVLKVSSLADSGAGSLREALMQKGPRTIEFAVEGEIALQSRLVCTEGRLTVDGTTAPGSGITLMHHGLSVVNGEDVILRGLRIRVTAGGASGDGLLLWGKGGGMVRRVLVDHCSIMGATDECINTWGRVQEVTFQWCVIAEAAAPHSMAWLSGQESDQITIHHCLLAACADRNPKLEGGRYDVVNNVIAGWKNNNGSKLRLGVRANFVGNVYVPGADSAAVKGAIFIESPPGRLALFLRDNVMHGENARPDQWNLVTLVEKSGARWVERNPAPEKYRVAGPLPAPAVTTQAAEDACELVLDRAGARVRDDHDLRVIETVRRLLK